MGKSKARKKLTGAARMRQRGKKSVPVYMTAAQHRELTKFAKAHNTSLSRLFLNTALYGIRH